MKVVTGWNGICHPWIVMDWISSFLQKRKEKKKGTFVNLIFLYKKTYRGNLYTILRGTDQGIERTRAGWVTVSLSPSISYARAGSKSVGRCSLSRRPPPSPDVGRVLVFCAEKLLERGQMVERDTGIIWKTKAQPWEWKRGKGVSDELISYPIVTKRNRHAMEIQLTWGIHGPISGYFPLPLQPLESLPSFQGHIYMGGWVAGCSGRGAIANSCATGSSRESQPFWTHVMSHMEVLQLLSTDHTNWPLRPACLLQYYDGDPSLHLCLTFFLRAPTGGESRFRELKQILEIWNSYRRPKYCSPSGFRNVGLSFQGLCGRGNRLKSAPATFCFCLTKHFGSLFVVSAPFLSSKSNEAGYPVKRVWLNQDNTVSFLAPVATWTQVSLVLVW